MDYKKARQKGKRIKYRNFSKLSIKSLLLLPQALLPWLFVTFYLALYFSLPLSLCSANRKHSS